MPKRVIDFDAMWASDKLAACAEWAQVEYAWLYGLADCNGCFELTNLRVIWGRVAAIRKNLSLERVAQVFDEFHDKGLLFRWSDGGKRYGHWTGSDVPGRLPPPSWRNRLERLAPPVPRAALEEYVAAFRRAETQCDANPGNNQPRQQRGSDLAGVEPVAQVSAALFADRPEASRGTTRNGEFSGTPQVPAQNAGDLSYTGVPASARSEKTELFVLKPCLEEAQAQDLDLDLVGKRDWETHTPCLQLGPEESLRAVDENSPPGKNKSVCESASTDFGEEKNKNQIPLEEIKSKTIRGEERKQKEIAADGEQTNCQSRSFVAKGALRPETRSANVAPLDDNGFGLIAPLHDNERVCASAGAIREKASPVAPEVDPMPGTPELPENRAGGAAKGNPRVQGNAGYSSTEFELCSPGSPNPGVSRAGSHSEIELAIGEKRTVAQLRDCGAHTEPMVLAEIWESERGSLPELRAMTAERVARCRERLRNAARGETNAEQGSALSKFFDDFREAVRRAAATPFLLGAGPAGWRANFDWLVANDTNYLKVLEGRYDSGDSARDAMCANAQDATHARSFNDGCAASSAPTKRGVAPQWIAERAAREESVRRELRVGTGPCIDHAAMQQVGSAEGASHGAGSAEGHSPGASAMRSAMRADVVERFRRRGQSNAAQRQAQS